MRAGLLRQTVDVKRRSTEKNSFGETVDEWVTIVTRRADIEPLSGKEYFANSGEDTNVTTRIRLRWEDAVADISPKDQIHHGTVIYNIKSVINQRELNRDLVLMCDRDA